ncbi:MAG: hypothetical protein OXF20_12855 [Gammaproteobacteria bacterium]|nr:hypothetical protein [Gammaproteobacteria bacterium]
MRKVAAEIAGLNKRGGIRIGGGSEPGSSERITVMIIIAGFRGKQRYAVVFIRFCPECLLP